VRNGDGMKKQEQEGHSLKPSITKEEKPRRDNQQSDIANDQIIRRSATGFFSFFPIIIYFSYIGTSDICVCVYIYINKLLT
jgi:hypothetical protein